MWDDILKHLPDFESAVLTGVDEEGYPFSVRCRPHPDEDTRVLRAQLPEHVSIRPGRASLLCHEHDENLWNLKSFLVRGDLRNDGREWSFYPKRFVPGVAVGGLMGMVRFVVWLPPDHEPVSEKARALPAGCALEGDQRHQRPREGKRTYPDSGRWNLMHPNAVRSGVVVVEDGLVATSPEETVRKASRTGQSPHHKPTHCHVDERLTGLR